MKATTAHPELNDAAHRFQHEMLAGVSRTFALTIPCLPEPLRTTVTNGYLLCRIADTIEDEPALDLETKRGFSRRFCELLRGEGSASAFSTDLVPLLSASTLPAERELIAHADLILSVTHRLGEDEQYALRDCIVVMSGGMHRYQCQAGRHGLRDLSDLDHYCYYVAGVVGEMLTRLFCAYSPEINKHRGELLRLAPSFGQGLQMTNILKDVWEDRQRGACWLPRSQFESGSQHIEDLPAQIDPAEFEVGLRNLISVAGAHLKNALAYTLIIPRHERGIRRFCLWALGLAVLTLRKINRNPGYRSGQEVKVTRFTVRTVVALGTLFAGSDRMLRWLYHRAASGLPEFAGSLEFVTAEGLSNADQTGPVALESGSRRIHSAG